MHQLGVGFAGFGNFNRRLGSLGHLVLRQDKMRRGKKDQAGRQNGSRLHIDFPLYTKFG
jgi:hypothetical protein